MSGNKKAWPREEFFLLAGEKKGGEGIYVSS